VEADLRPMNLGLATAKRRAQDRSAWRLLVATATSSTSSWRDAPTGSTVSIQAGWAPAYAPGEHEALVGGTVHGFADCQRTGILATRGLAVVEMVRSLAIDLWPPAASE